MQSHEAAIENRSGNDELPERAGFHDMSGIVAAAT